MRPGCGNPMKIGITFLMRFVLCIPNPFFFITAAELGVFLSLNNYIQHISNNP